MSGADPATVNVRPLIFWEGFPPCGLMTKKVVQHFGEDLVLLGTRAAVPFEGLEEMLGRRIEWLAQPDDIWDRREEFADRNLIIHTGWSHPGWLRFDRWARARGAKVVVAVDNRFKGNLRQWFGAIWFRIWLRRHFDAAFVPGRSATRLMRFLGMPAERIVTGYYGASEEIYSAGPPLMERRNEFLFIGQLIERKGVDVLLQGFRRYRQAGGTWDLRILGDGPMRDRCTGSGILFEGFAQARHASQRMKEARCLILPSREDHWGTVVCEAAASGALLVVSRWVGAAEDLVRHAVNGLVFHQMTPASLAEALHLISRWSPDTLSNAQSVSLGLSREFTSGSYAAAFEHFSKLVAPDRLQ
jgi:glycosyltransferase involved in cell wall biosynthesis